MGLTIKHVIELSPDTVALLQTIFGGRAQTETPAPAEGTPAKRTSTKKAETPVATPEPEDKLIAMPNTAEAKEDAPAKIKPLATQAAAGDTTYTMEQVREAAAELVRAGKNAVVKPYLEKYGVISLAKLAPEHYAAFMADLQELKSLHLKTAS